MDRKAKLIDDVLSVFMETREIPDKKSRTGFKSEKGQKILGKKNDEVKLINLYGGIWIVEAKDGNRFSTNQNNLNFNY